MDEIASAEGDVWRGRCPEKPFVLLVQPSLFDPARAPEGKHTAWAYCHVPNGSDIDMTVRIEAQVERFAPGFRDLVIGRNVMGPKTLEDFDANCIGGDIAGGANTLRQVFGRPVFSLNPYAMGTPGMFLCSASTPPGGGCTACAGTMQPGRFWRAGDPFVGKGTHRCVRHPRRVSVHLFRVREGSCRAGNAHRRHRGVREGHEVDGHGLHPAGAGLHRYRIVFRGYAAALYLGTGRYRPVSSRTYPSASRSSTTMPSRRPASSTPPARA
jgi:hypothetical protein